VAARGLPNNHIILHADGALVLDHLLLLGEGLVGDGGARVVGGDRGGVLLRTRTTRLGSYPLDVLEKESYPVVGTPRLVGGHLVRDRRPDKVYRIDDARDPLGDRRRVTDGALVGGGRAATLDGGGGESGSRGEVGLANWGDIITEPNSPTTTVGAHRGRTTALNCVLAVTDIWLPNDTGNVCGNWDLSAHLWGVVGWVLVV